MPQNHDYHRSTHRAEGVRFETLEERTLLAAAPIFASDLPEYIVIDSTGGVTLGIDGFDADGEDLDITVTAPDGSGVNTVIDDKDSGDRFALLHFTDGEGNAIGEVLVQLFEQRSPLATERFITLSTNYFDQNEDPQPATVDDPAYYTDVVVHRVIPEFMIQTGDAENGDGTGGSPLGDFDNEYDDYLSFAGRGVLATANAGVDTNDSQFFITDVPTSWLNDKHTIFGQLISGWDVYRTIINTPADSSDRPLDPPVLSSVEIVQSPQDGSVTFWVDETFTDQTEVTITLTDEFGVQVSQTVTLVPADAVGEERPDVSDIADQHYATGEISAGVPVEIPFQVTYDGSLPLGFDSWVVYDGPGTILTEIIEPAADGEDYHLRLTLPAEYDGSEIIVAASANLAGFDNVTPSVERFAVSLSERPAIDDPGVLDMAGGATEVFDLVIADTDSEHFTVTAETPQAGVTVSIDPDTYQLTITTPADFYGVFTVTVTAVETEFADFTGLTPGKLDITVATLGDRPTISPLAGDEVRIAQGATAPADPVTLTIVDDGGEAMNVEIATDQDDVTVAISDDDGDGVYDVSITIPDDFLGAFEVTVTAVEDVAGADDLTPGEYVFTVTTLGDRPTIANPAGDYHLVGGDYVSFDAGIVDDSGLALDVAMETNMASTYVWMDEVLAADGQVDHWQVTIDLRNLPVDYSGFFKVTLSAIEADIDGGVEPTENAFYVFAQPAFDPPYLDVLETTNESKVTRIVGDRLYVGTTKGLEIYDLSDPTDPQELGSFATSYEISDIETAGDTVYLAMRGAAFGTWVYGQGKVYILDITDPADIQTAATITTTSLVTGIELQGDTLYVANYTAGLAIYDIADTDAIEDPERFTEIDGHALATVNDLTLNGNVLYVMDNDEQLLTIDVTDPLEPAVTDSFRPSLKTFWGYDPNGHRIKRYSSFGTPSMAVVEGDRLALADSTTGLWLFDISDPTRTEKIGWLGWPATFVAVEGNLAIISDDGFHRYVDLSDPDNIHVTQRSFAPGWVGMPSIVDGLIAAPYGEEGIAIIDGATLQDMTTYTRRAEITTPDETELTFQVNGNGLLRIHRDGDGELTNIELVGTDERTTFIITAPAAGAYELCDISIYGSLRGMIVRNAVVAGDLTINGTIRTLRLDDVGGATRVEQTLTIAGAANMTAETPANITMGDVTDLRLISAMPINRIVVSSWLDDESDLGADIDEVDRLEAPSLKLLKVTDGDFQADVILNADGDAPDEIVMGGARIAGELHQSDWTIHGKAGVVSRGSEGDWTYDDNNDNAHGLQPTYVFGRRVLELDDGTRAVVRISGGGAVLLTPSSDAGVDFDAIEIIDATDRTRIAIDSPDRDLTVADLSADSNFALFDADGLALLGDAIFDGIFRRLVLGDVGLGDRVEQTLRIDGTRAAGDPPLQIRLGAVTDLSLVSASAITRLDVESWSDDETDIDDATLEQDSLIAPSIDLLNVDGDFQASVNINADGADDTAEVVLARAIVGGDVSDGEWTLNGRLGRGIFRGDVEGLFAMYSAGAVAIAGDLDGATVKLARPADDLGRELGLDRLNVGGTINASRLLAAGNIGVLTASAITASDIYAGYIAETDDAVTGLPTADAFPALSQDNFDALGEIRRIKVTGPRDGSPWQASFTDTAIAAGQIRQAIIRDAETDAAGDEFGITANHLWRFVYRDADRANNQTWRPGNTSAPAALENFVVRIV